MNAILKAPVDLLWFGGIGTYVRASGETNQEVGDRANDAIRVTALEVRAKVIGEGANLGVTQRARIEFGLQRRGLQFRRHRQFRRRQLVRRRGQHQDRAGLRHAQGQPDPAGAQQAAGRDDRRGRPARARQQLPADAGAVAGCASAASPTCLTRPLHDGAGGARPARPRRRDAAVAAGAGRARGARRAADPRRARRAARLCQDRAVLRHRRQQRSRRSAFRARPASTISRPAWRRNTRPRSAATGCGARSSRASSPTIWSIAAARPSSAGCRT